MKQQALITQIDAILPQTQCGQCSYAGCKPYAVAIAEHMADINQCPPGGEAGIHALATLLNVPYKPLNPTHGEYKPKALARIDEAVCIGCTLCIQACPVDAILGASKQMHTVISRECTGCELCIAPCPVDCIVMEPMTVTTAEQSLNAANVARSRFEARLARLAQEESVQANKALSNNATTTDTETSGEMCLQKTVKSEAAKSAKQIAIAAAMARAKAQKEALNPPKKEPIE